MEFKKQNEIKDVELKKLSAQNLENLFYVYQTENSEYFYNILKTVNFPDDIDPSHYSNYVTKPKDTWPMISYNFYKDVKVWWLVCSINGIIDPTKQPVPGTVLKILHSDIVRGVLNRIKER